MSRGFHAFFRQYYNLRALLRRIDPDLQSLVGVPDYPLISADGHADSFARIPETPPLNIATFVMQSPSFRLRDLAAVNVPAALELLDVDFPATFSRYDGESASFLDRLHFPPTARHLALEVFSRSFFAHPDDFSAGELVAMFHAYFLGSSEGLLFDVPRDDYDSCLWSPLRRYLERLGPRCARPRASPGWMRGTNCCGSGWDPAPRSKRLRLCSRPIRPVCRGSLSNLDWVMSRGVNGWRRPVMHPVRGLAAVAGSSGCTRSPRVLGNQRLRPTGQHFGAGALRGGCAALVGGAWWFGCRAARVRAG